MVYHAICVKAMAEFTQHVAPPCLLLPPTLCLPHNGYAAKHTGYD